MFANELFCNSNRSYPGLFKMITDYKQEFEIITARELICENTIYKTIIEDLRFRKRSEWNCFGDVNGFNCKIIYRINEDNYHCFSFIYKDRRYKRVKIKFRNRIHKSFKECFFDELRKYPNLKHIFTHAVLVGELRKHPTFY